MEIKTLFFLNSSSVTVSAVALSLLLPTNSGATTNTPDFRDFIISAYDAAFTLKSLTTTQNNPDYDRLISECRYNLYNAMSHAAATGKWSETKHLIPPPEVCSYTGKLKPASVQEYQDNWTEAENVARRFSYGRTTDNYSKQIAVPKPVAGLSPDDTVSTPPKGMGTESLPMPTFEDLTAQKKEIVTRTSSTEKPFESCETAMKYKMEVALISKRLSFNEDELSRYNDDMRYKSRRSCICIIQKLTPALDTEESIEYYDAILENYNTNINQFLISAAIKGLDERKLKATLDSVVNVVSQCPASQ